MNIQHILWSKLVASPRNARKVKADVMALAMSLAADGLIQNITVAPRQDGKFEVIAGERRRRAIVQLVRAGTWERDIEIPCEVRDAEDATGVSYAENAQRVAMHPADAIRAFASLAADGHDDAAIAHRYGYDPREIRKMLALALVSPKVINALAADKIDLSTAQAFTLTDDHKRQERVLRRARSAHEVRSLLTEAKVTTGHRLFRFVGMDDYQAAGGTLTGDLFAKEGEGYADDPALVQQLADEKLDRLAAEVEAEGWGEVLPCETTPYDSYKWHRLYPDAERRTLSPEDESKLAEYRAERDAVVAEIGDDAEHDDEVVALDEAIDGIGTVERSFSDEVKAGGLVLLTIDHQGAVNRTYYSRKALRAVARDEKGTPLPRPLYDARMVEDLSRVRTAALQSEVAANQSVAFAVLLDALLPLALGSGIPSPHAVQLRGGSIQSPVSSFDISTRQIGSPFEHVADLIEAMPRQPDERLGWLLTLDTRDVDQLLAACTGALIDATHRKFAEGERLRSADRIARAVALDMRQHWEGGIEFYDRLTRKTALAALTEARGPSAAENCAKLKKPELAVACNDRITGTGWLPPSLVTPDVQGAAVEIVDDAVAYLPEADNDDEVHMIAAE
ncbi:MULTISPECIES: ParB/RepB/Spo0J family partition protein [unclassified Sphingomonas]|uniref:ParB/RepB/Spo0J family partition protein n=1 Tax=unclassified Sphingomonas TaxID=196159 RepID=UPI00226A0CF7|nr:MULTISPECIES: ParB/RepB/Spo0J family partition protein [unclassified Sphingomonas]